MHVAIAFGDNANGGELVYAEVISQKIQPPTEFIVTRIK